MNILFIGCRYIGDAVLSLGVMEWMLQQWPHASITVATPAAPADFYHAIPQVSKIMIMHKTSLAGHWLKLWRHVGFKKWDVVVDMRGSGLAYTVVAGKRLVWRAPDTDQHRLEQLAQFVGSTLPLVPRIHVTQEDRETIRDATQVPPLVMAPGANWVGKQWPIEKFIALVHRLIAPEGLFPAAPLLVLAGPGEREMCRPLLEAFPSALDGIGKFTLRQVYALLERSALFVGNDSGLMHIAASAGVPTVGLFGPSREVHFAPRGACTRLVRTPESYAELVAFVHGGNYPGGSVMTGLEVDTVYKACQEVVTLSSVQKEQKASLVRKGAGTCVE